jgi:hypothetical protein
MQRIEDTHHPRGYRELRSKHSMSQLVSAATDRETRGSSDITLQSGCRNLLTVIRRDNQLAEKW